MMASIDKYKSYSPVLVRIAVSLVFLWFGVNQLISPESFLGYVPEWIYSNAAEISGLPHLLIIGNGVFETLLGSLLLLGVFTRIASLLMGIHLAAIAFSLGYNDIAVRDIGISLATFSVFLNGSDRFCLENKLKQKFPKLLKKLVW
jgi:uncharacterized membrane protein YphA (DoxX/SURF4 family)